MVRPCKDGRPYSTKINFPATLSLALPRGFRWAQMLPAAATSAPRTMIPTNILFGIFSPKISYTNSRPPLYRKISGSQGYGRIGTRGKLEGHVRSGHGLFERLRGDAIGRLEGVLGL